MKKYVIILKDKISNEIEDGLNRRHVAYLKESAINGRLFLCGPLIGHGGAMQIILADSEEEAREYVNKDPFVLEGFYRSYDIYMLLEANLNNNFLLKD